MSLPGGKGFFVCGGQRGGNISCVNLSPCWSRDDWTRRFLRTCGLADKGMKTQRNGEAFMSHTAAACSGFELLWLEVWGQEAWNIFIRSFMRLWLQAVLFPCPGDKMKLWVMRHPSSLLCMEALLDWRWVTIVSGVFYHCIFSISHYWYTIML